MKYDVFSSKYYGVDPEPVNFECTELDREMQQGYGYDFSGKKIKAVKSWNMVFTKIKAYFAEHQFSDINEFDKIFNGNQYVSNWVQDYDDALRNVLVDCSDEEKQLYGKQKIELLTFLLEINTSGDLSHLNNMRSLAETYYMLGNHDMGEKLFLKLIQDYPDNVWGYIGYSDEYWLEYTNNRDYEKALKILLDAYNRITIEESDIIIERLTDLQISMKKKELEEYLNKKDSNVVPKDISVADALEQIRLEDEEIPFQYLKFIEDNKEAAKTFIMDEMKCYIENPDSYAKNNGFLSVYIPFILGQWEEKKSSKDIIDLVACSDDSIDIRIGYSIIEEYPIVLYKCFDGDTAYLENVIKQEGISSFSKLAYLKALSMYYIADMNNIEGLKVYLEKLIKEQPELATWISDIVLMHQREELVTAAELCLKSKFYNPSVNGKRSEFMFHFHNGSRDETEKYKLPFNATAAMKKWSQFDAERPIVPEYNMLYQKLLNAREEKMSKSGRNAIAQDNHQPVVKGRKIGRNEPCPCGSGKKYKKCCGK